MFKEVSNKLNLADLELKILEFWEKEKIFKKSLKLRKDAREFVFYEGPPTANGKPGIHHVIARTVKDVVCRYKSMKGFLVNRKAGWDTHGLPVEIEIEKSLNISGKDEIEKFGIAKFNKKCKDSVFEYKKEWDTLTERIGYWLDLENPYITFTNEYIESVWWILKEIWKKDLLYQGFKIQPYCPRCETPLSSHEVSQGYKDVKDPSIYVRMKLKGLENTYFMVWTTTPWTLISNVALAVGQKIDYVEIKTEQANYIMAQERVSDLFKEDEYEVVKNLKGKDLQGLEYHRLFDFVPVDKKAFYVISGDFVTTSDGTGIVHIAPAFGEDDYQAGLKYDLPVLRPVDKEGKFEQVVSAYKDTFVKEADLQIILDLKQNGSLIKKQMIEHSYPHCWRCSTPLLYYARDSWFIRTTRYKERLLANNEQMKWHPPEVGYGRFNEWLKNNIDWSLSRDRYWGTPLNIWICNDCGEESSIGSIEELRDRGQNVPEDIDLHKPYVDEITLECEKCKGIMRRVPEVIDAWFDSGSMPYAQHHYPFENKENFDKLYPADFICEGIDQTRGWFYSLLAISTLLFDRPPIKNIVVNELILDKDGQKMSKSKGNAVVPEHIISKYGADTLRWYLMTVSPPWIPKRFDEEGIKEVLRKFMNTLLNTYSFFILYANIDEYKGNEKEVSFEDRQEIDRWILSKLYSVVAQVNEYLEAYELTKAARLISDYVVDDVSNWYIRRNRRRFWKGDDSNDKLSAYQTLHEVLITIARLIAPYAPFLADEIYTNLSGSDDPESVHLGMYPEVGEKEISRQDADLEERMAIAQKVVSISHSLRNDSNVRVRQPLSRVIVSVTDSKMAKSLEKMSVIICEELNVKNLELIDSADDLIEKTVKPNFKALGPKVGKLMGKIAPIMENFGSEQIQNIETSGFERLSIEGQEIKITAEDVEIRTGSKEGLAVYSDPEITVAIDLTLSEELINEGLARELVNRIQNMRKDSGFSVTDRIDIYFENLPVRLSQAIDQKNEYIKNETLVVNFLEEVDDNLIIKEISIAEDTFSLGLKKTNNI
jgi:isoleucyl-tRNA synthetase